MPIAAQLMVLLVGVLIVAQGATLVLTLAFPPQPPIQHSLEDIARTLGGEQPKTDGARPLVRRLSDTAPRPEGPGWISAAAPRQRLADLLEAEPDDVVLMFYLPLPAGAQPMALPAPAQARPWPPSPAESEIETKSAPEPAALPDQEPAVVAAAFAPTGAAPLLMRARYSPGEQSPPFAARPPAGFGAAALPQGQSGRFPAMRNSGWPQQADARPTPPVPAGRAAQPRPWANAGRDFSEPRATAARAAQTRGFTPPASATGSPSRPFVGEAWPRPVAPPGNEKSMGQIQETGRPPILSDRAKALVGAFADRRQVLASTGVILSASVAASIPLPSATPATRTTVPVVTSPVVPTSPPASRDVPTPAAPQLQTPTLPPIEITVETSPAARDALAPDTAVLAPVAASAPVRRGLFASAPAGYIEGDFVAARRIGDRWVVVEPQAEGFPTAWQSRVMLWFLLSFALVAPFGWLFARRITAPLRSFADAAERLGRDPSASTTVQGGSAEIGRAAAAFNQMQARLKRYVDDRTAMIGAISHDLRTPLTRMRFRLEAAPERMKPGFETDIDQMEAMISSVLAFMRDQAEGGSRQRLDLRALLKEAGDNAVAGGANVAIEPGEAVEVDADAVALNRVFANLLDNAVKYGDRAVVRLVREGDDVVAAVHDFGPGLPDSELERVFKPFYRTPGAAASEAPGIGLGLANSRAIVLAHGGTIRLKSNGGLTAEVRLPIAA